MSFVERIGEDTNPMFNISTLTQDGSPAIADLTGDGVNLTFWVHPLILSDMTGLPDLVVGRNPDVDCITNSQSCVVPLRFFENIGSIDEGPRFQLRIGRDSPVYNLSSFGNGHPALHDVDGDGLQAHDAEHTCFTPVQHVDCTLCHDNRNHPRHCVHLLKLVLSQDLILSVDPATLSSTDRTSLFFFVNTGNSTHAAFSAVSEGPFKYVETLGGQPSFYDTTFVLGAPGGLVLIYLPFPDNTAEWPLIYKGSTVLETGWTANMGDKPVTAAAADLNSDGHPDYVVGSSRSPTWSQGGWVQAPSISFFITSSTLAAAVFTQQANPFPFYRRRNSADKHIPRRRRNVNVLLQSGKYLFHKVGTRTGRRRQPNLGDPFYNVPDGVSMVLADFTADNRSDLVMNVDSDGDTGKAMLFFKNSGPSAAFNDLNYTLDPYAASLTNSTYQQITSGTCSDEQGCSMIRVKGTCEEAANVLNLGDASVKLVFKSGLPTGCVFSKGTLLKFNIKTTSITCSANNACICKCNIRSQMLTAGDLNGDGMSDIVAGNGHSGDIVWYRNVGTPVAPVFSRASSLHPGLVFGSGALTISTNAAPALGTFPCT